MNLKTKKWIDRINFTEYNEFSFIRSVEESERDHLSMAPKVKELIKLSGKGIGFGRDSGEQKCTEEVTGVSWESFRLKGQRQM